MPSIVVRGEDGDDHDRGAGDRPARGVPPEPPDTGETVSLGSYASGGSRYRLIRPIGRGGIGEVWLARDLELNRDVALKQLLGKHAASEDFKKAFLREIRAGAVLEHPGIIPIYDIGQHPDGRLFGVMRYFGESDFNTLIRDYHRDHPGEVADIPFRALLGHFVAACRAIAYAHAREVIHLDIKPANVITGPFGETQVIDWGMAWLKGQAIWEQVAESSGGISGGGSASGGSGVPDMTKPRGFKGTPAYAAPEQHRQKWDAINARTDVYGLGATLHFLLACAPPFDIRQDTFHADVLAGHRHSEPKPWAPRALAAIARKAMAPDPKARYASAAELADDVDRFLADEPVKAFPDPPSVRAWRFVKRHRALAAAAAALLLTSAVALGIGIVAVSRQRDIAKENAAATRRVIEKFIRVVADQEWAAIPGTADLRLKAVTNVLDEYPRLIEQQADDPDLRFDAAVLDLHCANLYRTLGDLTRANELYLQSRDAMGKLMSAHPRNTTYHLAWGHLLCDAGDVALRAHGPSEAIGTFEETLRQAESLAERQPDDPNVRILLARVRTDIADALLEAGSITEACKFAELGANDFITLVGHEGDDYQIRLMAVIARVVSAKAARVSGRIPDARKWADGAVTEADRLGIDFPGPSDVDWVRAISLLERARLESKAAIASSPSPKSTMEEALEAARALVKSSPNVPVYRRLLSEMLVDQVDCLLSVAKPVDAVDAAREAVVLLGGPKSLADSTEGEGMPRMNIETHRLIARAYAALGRALRVAEDDAGASWAFAAARPHFDAAIEAAPRNGSLRTEADAANSQ